MHTPYENCIVHLYYNFIIGVRLIRILAKYRQLLASSPSRNMISFMYELHLCGSHAQSRLDAEARSTAAVQQKGRKRTQPGVTAEAQRHCARKALDAVAFQMEELRMKVIILNNRIVIKDPMDPVFQGHVGQQGPAVQDALI